MKKILFLIAFFTIALYTKEIVLEKNPRVYAALGNVLYDNVEKIQRLKEIESFNPYLTEINRYVRDLLELKKQGFAIEAGVESIDKKLYLQQLREFAKTNDHMVSLAKSTFRSSITNEDSKTFEKIINSGLIDTKRNKARIIDYYFSHQEEVNPQGIIQAYLEEDAKLRARREAKKKYYKSKKEREAERIRRIRENDKRKQAALEKKLNEELMRKKQEIRQEQKKELFNN